MVTAETRIDPVCGMTVNPDSAAGSFAYNEKTYYFCSLHCLEKFKADPDRFLNSGSVGMVAIHGITRQPTAAHPVTLPSGSDKANYTCPMHPEVSQPRAGACPKCGMALETSAPIMPAEKIEYTCPMHPEIIRDQPGSCPICGMALEPRVISLAELENPELTDMRRRFWVCAILTIPVFAIGMSDLIPGAPLQELIAPRVLSWIQLVLGPGSQS